MIYLVGIDIGTSATKTVLFDEKGAVAASSTNEYPLYQPNNGWAEQKPEDWKDAVLKGLADVVKQSGVKKEEVKGIGLSGQMHGLVMLDEAGEVIRPSILWCDQRTGAEVDDMLSMFPREKWIELTGNPPLTGWTAAKILWVKKNESENYARCRHILLPKDYIRYVLTGEFATEVSDASGMQLLDVKNRCWSKTVLEKLDIDQSYLGKIYESCEITGYLKTALAAQVGLTEQTAVVGGAGDNAGAAIGTGIVKDNMAFTTIGTSGVVYAHSSSYAVDKKGRVHTCCSCVPGEWHLMGVTQGAGLSLKWFKDNCCQDYVMEAEKEGVDVYDLINRDIKKRKTGSNKLVYLPYLMGERTPHLDPDCRGVFFGLSAIHTKADMLRAIMEGVSFSLKDCNDILQELEIHVDNMMACGGGGKSPIWRRMLADMYHCKVSTIKQEEGPALGVAILAAVGVGIYDSVEQACDAIIITNNTYEPVEETSKKYDALHEVYKEVYVQLKGTYKKLAALDL